MFSDFYDAWWFLYNHPMFKNEYGYSSFQSCIDIEVVKVNPITSSIDDNKELNTKVEIWLETGEYDKNYRCHDISLDTGGDTFEEAIINLANKIYISI